MSGSLYIVSTPIGNLDDMTFRAVQVLRDVTIIACEDTRHTRKLLTHFGIETPTISYHDHNERERAQELIKRLKSGDNIAVVSDAGTPGINDPGFRLVQLAIENEINVVPVPGANAVIAALVTSGLPTDRFFFEGFLPPRSNARRTRLQELSTMPATLVFYEAPHRIAATLKDAFEVLGQRNAVVGRELTKLHEEFVRGNLSELAQKFSFADKARGEMVLLISGRSEDDAIERTNSADTVSSLVAEFEGAGLDHRAALKKAARALGMTRDEAYRRLIAERGSNY